MSILDNWNRMPVRNRFFAVGVAIAIAMGLSAMIQSARTPQMALLYAGLDSSSAGEVLQALESMDIKSDVRGDAIYVAENRRDAVRMSLAREGLPRQEQAGFELLDQLSGFSATSEMFDAAYWRAKEGELARTILATPGVKSVRVHIAIPQRSAFSRNTPPPTAVVTVGMARGALSLDKAEAARYVVALAIPNLAPGQVVVIDAANGVVLTQGADDASKRALERARSRENELESALVGLLEAHVGPGNARVKVAIDLSHEELKTFERTLDPQRRILTTKDTSEIQESGSDGAGAVTVASNLPDGDAAPAPTARSQRNETTESTKFDVSETRRETISTPGAVKRVQVAVLINAPQAAGDSAGSPPSSTDLKALRNLVAAAVGYDESRGDVISIEALAFDTPEPLGQEETPNAAIAFLSANFMSILQIVIPALVTMILALFVLKPLLSSAPRGETNIEVKTPTSPAGEITALPPQAVASSPTPIDELRKIAAERKAESAEVLKNWLEQPERAA